MKTTKKKHKKPPDQVVFLIILGKMFDLISWSWYYIGTGRDERSLLKIKKKE